MILKINFAEILLYITFYSFIKIDELRNRIIVIENLIIKTILSCLSSFKIYMSSLSNLLMFRHLIISTKRYRHSIYCLKFINVFNFQSEGNPDQNLAGILPSQVRIRSRLVIIFIGDFRLV